MAQEEIEIQIAPNGKVTVRTIGIKGAKCLDYAEFLAQLIGREETREMTSEFYEGDAQVQRQVDVKQRR